VLDLNEIEKKVDEALAKATPESWAAWEAKIDEEEQAAELGASYEDATKINYIVATETNYEDPTKAIYKFNTFDIVIGQKEAEPLASYFSKMNDILTASAVGGATDLFHHKLPLSNSSIYAAWNTEIIRTNFTSIKWSELYSTEEDNSKNGKSNFALAA